MRQKITTRQIMNEWRAYSRNVIAEQNIPDISQISCTGPLITLGVFRKIALDAISKADVPDNFKDILNLFKRGIAGEEIEKDDEMGMNVGE